MITLPKPKKPAYKPISIPSQRVQRMNYAYRTQGLKTSPKYPDWFRYGNNECPKCHAKDSGCSISADGLTISCVRESLGAYASKPSDYFGTVYFHNYDESDERPDNRDIRDIIKIQHVSKLASDQVLHTSYIYIKKMFPLNAHHAEYLDNEGIFDHKRYFSIPKPVNERFWSILIPDSIPDGVPGFYKKGDKTYLNGYFWGMGIMHMNAEGKCIAVEIRLDEDCKNAHGINKERSVYRPLVSTAEWQGGTAPEQSYTCWLNHQSHEIWITEGAKKGAVLAEQKGVNVIALRGVSNWRQALKPFATMVSKVKNLRRVVLALDMDRHNTSGKHQAVKAAHEGLRDLLVEEKILEVYEADWNPEYKGIDDLLNAGHEPVVLSLNNQTYVDLVAARDQLSNEIHKAIVSGNPKFNVFEVSAGVGKTYATIQALNKMDREGWPKVKGENGYDRDVKIAMTFDNNSLVKEMLSLFEFPVTPLEGRSDDEMSIFLCRKKEDIDKIAAAGQNTQKHGCVKCSYRSMCMDEGYLGAVEMLLGQRFILTNKDAIMNRSKRLDSIDVLIIDEGIRAQLNDEMIGNIGDLELNLIACDDQLYALNTELDELTGYDKQTDKRKERAQSIKYQIQDIKDMKKQLAEYIELLQEDEQPEHHKRLAPKFFNVEFPAYVGLPSDGCQYDGTDDGFGMRKCWIKPVFVGANKAAWQTPDGEILVKCLNERIIELLNDRVVINLDATPIDAYLSLFTNVNRVKMPVKEHVVIHSILDRKFSKTQLKKNEHYADDLTNTIKFLREKHHGNIGVLTSKYFAEVLFDNGFSEDEVGWYGKDTRGSNRMKNVEAIIIAGPYIENMGAVNRDVEMFHVAGHTDITLEQIQAQITSAETIQAIARGRGVNRTKDFPLHVYKLTSLKIDGVTENLVYSNCTDLMDEIPIGSRKSSDSKKSRQAAMDLVTQKGQTLGEIRAQSEAQKQAKIETEKTGSNPMIAENVPQYESLHNKYKIAIAGGYISEDTPTVTFSLLEELVEDSARLKSETDYLKNISKKIWIAYLRAKQEGADSISCIAKIVGCSEKTVKMVNNAFKVIIGIKRPQECEAPAPELSKAISEYAIENHFESLLETAREQVPDHKVFTHAKDHNVESIPEMEQAVIFLEKFPDPDQFDDGIAWYWMCFFKHYSTKFLQFLTSHRPDIVLDYFLSIESEEIVYDERSYP